MILLCLGEKTRKLLVNVGILSRAFLCGSELLGEIPTRGLCSLAGQIFRKFFSSPDWYDLAVSAEEVGKGGLGGLDI